MPRFRFPYMRPQRECMTPEDKEVWGSNFSNVLYYLAGLCDTKVVSDYTIEQPKERREFEATVKFAGGIDSEVIGGILTRIINYGGVEIQEEEKDKALQTSELM